MAVVGRAGQRMSVGTPTQQATRPRAFRGGGGSSGSSSKPQVNVRFGKQNEIFINGRGFSVRPQDQASFITSRGGSVTSNIARQINAQKLVAKENARQEKIKQEQQRQIELRNKLIREGAQVNERILRNQQGERIRMQVVINNRTKERLLTSTNLNTGVKTTRRFQRSKGGGGARETGGLSQNTKKGNTQINFNNQLNKFIKSEQAKIKTTNRKLTRIEKINLFGARLSGREQEYLDSLTLRDLNKERDQIYAKIGRVNSHYTRYPPTTEAEYTQYQKDISPLLARYNTYANAKKIVLKNQPDNRTSATLEYDPVLNRNVLVLGAKDRSLTNRINVAVNKSTTTIQRKKGVGSNTLRLSALIVAQTAVGTAKGIVGLPSFANAVRKNPAILKRLPSAISQAGKDFGTLLRISPTSALVKIGANIYMIKVTDAGFRALGRLSSSAFVRLNPKFVGVLKAGQKIVVKTGKGKKVKLQVVSKIPGQTIAKQIGLSGKKVKVAVSTQADSLLGLIRRSKTLSKPLGIQKALGKTASRLLKQYDKGARLSTKQIKFLDNAIKKAGSKGLLERAFFADPTGKIRPSRLGIIKPKKLKLIDYLTSDFTFKKARPQILLFENAVIEKFPKAIKVIAKKLSRGQSITPDEASRLLQFQLKNTGKFKPLGFASKESEIVLGAGSVIKRVKKVGVTRINGVNIPIIKVRIAKLPKSLKNALDKFKSGKLTTAEIKKLDNALSKSTGFKYGLSSSGRSGIRYVSLKRLGLSVSSRVSRKRTSRKSPVSRKSKISKTSRSPKSRKSKTPRGSKSPRRPRGSKSPRSPRLLRSPKSPKSPRSPKSPPKRKPIPKKPPVRRRVPKKQPTRKLSKAVDTYFIKYKVRGKFVRNKFPLTKNDARDLLARRLDHLPSRVSQMIPAGRNKVVGNLPIGVRGYYSKTSKKFKKYKIVRKKKKTIRGYQEKRKYSLDKPKERKKRKTTIKTKRPVRRVKRRMLPMQRKVMLRNLKRARSMRKK